MPVRLPQNFGTVAKFSGYIYHFGAETSVSAPTLTNIAAVLHREADACKSNVSNALYNPAYKAAC